MFSVPYIFPEIHRKQNFRLFILTSFFFNSFISNFRLRSLMNSTDSLSERMGVVFVNWWMSSMLTSKFHLLKNNPAWSPLQVSFFSTLPVHSLWKVKISAHRQKKKYKPIFDSDILVSNKWKYTFLGSFKRHTYC